MAQAVEIRITASDGASQTFRAVGQSAQQMGQQIEQAGTESKQAFSDLTSELSTVGTAMVGVGAAITGALAAPLALGTKAAFAQVNAVEQATFALGAYGDSAEDVNAVLQDLTAYAQDASRSGGIFWSEDLYAAAQNLVVMGAELENVSEYVQIMSRSVGLGASTWDELNMIIGRVVATGKLAGNEFDELTKAGFRLDPALRNATLSAEELFEALDRGIPAESLLGQADTIRGRLLYLQGALINLGQAFLGVNEDLEFTAGGLGDTLTTSITQAREVLLSMVPAAEAAGGAMATLASFASTMVDGFLMLPGPVQTAGATLTAMVGATSLLGGAFLMLLPRIIETRAALQALGGVRGVLTGVLGAINPVALALAGIVTVGALVAGSWIEQKQAAAEYTATLTTLEESLEAVRRQGDEQLFELGDSVKDQVEAIRAELESFDDIELPDPADFVSDDPFDTGYGEALAEAEQQIADIQERAELAGPALDALNAALNDPTVDADAYFRWAEGLLEAARATPQVTDDIEALNSIIATQEEMPSRFLRAYADDADAAAASVDLLTDVVARQSAEALNAQATLGDYIEQQAIWLEQNREVADSVREIAGWDNALSTINMTAMANEWSRFAEEGIRAGEALDNTFRIIVGNTNAIIQQVEGVQSWADELINVRGELGLIDDLLAGGFIDIAQYNAAQDAYDGIAVSVEQVRNNLLAVQAMQAPFIAEAVEGTAAWTEELRNMEAAQQRTALAFMDVNTVAQAQEIVMLANTEAFRAMGDEGHAAFEAMIQGAAQTNPMLLEVLDTMGIIDQTEFGFDVNWDALYEGGNAIADLTTNVGNLVDTLREIYGLPPIEVEANLGGDAEEKVLSVQEAVGALAGTSVEVQVHAALNQPAGDLAGGASLLAGGLNAALGIPDEVNVGVRLEIQQGGADVGDGTGGAGNWSAMLGVPESVDVPVTPVAEGEVTAETLGVPESVDLPVVPTVEGEVTAASLGIPESIEIPVTLDLDASALNPYGLGFGDGEGAAGFTAPSVAIDVRIGQNELDDFTVPEVEDVTVNVAAPGAALAANALNNVTIAANAIPEAESVSVAAPGAALATNALNNVTTAAQGIPDSEQVAVVVVGAEAAVNSLNAVSNAANNIPASVTTSITTYNDTINRTFTQGQAGRALGGAVWGGGMFSGVAAANGRTVMVGEAGPELVNLPHGSQVTPHGASMSRLEAQGGGATEVHIHIDRAYGLDDLAGQVFSIGLPKVAEEVTRLHQGVTGRAR